MARIDDFDEDRFLQSVTANAPTTAVRNAIIELLKFAKDNSDVIKGGKASLGSFHYQIDIDAKTLTLFTVDATGYISVSLGSFVKRPPIVLGKNIVKLRSTLANISGTTGRGFESFRLDYDSRPGFSIAETVVSPNVMKQFQSALLKFQRDAPVLW